MMKKDPSINYIVQKIKNEPEFKGVKIVDYWESDLCAIGFRKNGILVYVSTYNSLIDKNKVYDMVVECFNRKNENVEIKAVSEEKLLEKLAAIFDNKLL